MGVSCSDIIRKSYKMNKDIFKLPNILSLLRMIMAMVLYILYVRTFQEPGFMNPMALFLVYAAIAITDYIDGIIARKFNMITELGKELDPLADKVLVFLMLFAFYRISLLPLWVILPVFARDIFVNQLRKRSKEYEIKFKTSNIAKAKTAIQMLFIGFVLAIPVLMSWSIPETLFEFLADIISGNTIVIIMCVIMLFTVYTGMDYWVKYKKAMKEIE